MIVVLVYRPEAAELDPRRPHEEYPFDGIEIYGTFFDAEGKAVEDMVNKLADANPKWHFHISPGEKIKVGLPATLRGKP